MLEQNEVIKGLSRKYLGSLNLQEEDEFFLCTEVCSQSEPAIGLERSRVKRFNGASNFWPFWVNSQSSFYCFQMEKAWWEYMEHYCFEGKLPSIEKARFGSKFFSSRPGARKFCSRLDHIIKSWEDYRARIPRAGCIIVS